jgi:hypothetical protein
VSLCENVFCLNESPADDLCDECLATMLEDMAISEAEKDAAERAIDFFLDTHG